MNPITLSEMSDEDEEVKSFLHMNLKMMRLRSF